MRIENRAVVGLSAGASLLGFLLHNLREFGPSRLLDPGTFTLPGILIGAGLFLLWLLAPNTRRGTAVAMLSWALLNLIGGAILSVLPIGLFPFTPEQSLAHYLSHLLYGILQIPLIWATIRDPRGQPSPITE